MTKPTDLRLPSRDLLLDHVREVSLALDHVDQCECGHYLHRQRYFDGAVVVNDQVGGGRVATKHSKHTLST